MNEKNSIGAFQLCCIFFLSRVLALFTFILPESERLAAGDRPLLFLPFFVFGLLVLLPAFVLCKRKESVFDLTDRVSPNLTRFCAVLFALGAVWSATVGLARVSLFAGTVLFEGGSLTLPMLGLTASTVIVAVKGRETVARAAVIVAGLLVFVFLFVLATTAKGFDVANLEPPFENGVLSFMKQGILAVTRTPELGALLLLVPNVKGNVRKNTSLWLLFFGITASASFLIITGVTGAFGERQMFQLYTLTTLSKLGAMERMDDIFAAVWVLAALIRTAFFLRLGGECVTRVLSKTSSKHIIIFLGAAAFGLCLLLSGSVVTFADVLASGGNVVMFVSFIVLLPVVVLIAEKMKQKRERNRLK